MTRMPEQIRYRLSREQETPVSIRVFATESILRAATDFDEVGPLSLKNHSYGVGKVALLEAAAETGAYRVTLPLSRIGTRRRPDYRIDLISNTMRTLNAIEWAAKYEIKDDGRLITFNADQSRFNDGRMPMYVKILKPEQPDSYITSLATASMRLVAKATRYNHLSEWSRKRNDEHLASSVYAQYQRAYGATLETNPMGSCSIGTDGNSYESEDPFIKLSAHNIYSPEQQLICLAGAIAIAECAEA